MTNSLDFEQPIVDLEAKIEELRRVDSAGELDLQSEIQKLELKSQKLQWHRKLNHLGVAEVKGTRRPDCTGAIATMLQRPRDQLPLTESSIVAAYMTVE